MVNYARKRKSKKLDKNELLHTKKSQKIDVRILKRKHYEDNISDKKVFNLRGGDYPMWSSFVVKIPGRGKLAKTIAYSKIVTVRMEETEEKFKKLMTNYNKLKKYLVTDLNPLIDKLLRVITDSKNKNMSFKDSSMVKTHKNAYKVRNKINQKLFGIRAVKSANNFFRSVEKIIQIRKMDAEKATSSEDIAEKSVSKKKDKGNENDVRGWDGFFTRSRNVLALRCSRLGNQRIECLVKKFRKSEKSYNNTLAKLEKAKEKFRTHVDGFLDDSTKSKFNDDEFQSQGLQVELNEEFIPAEFKKNREEISKIFGDAVSNINNKLKELTKKMDEEFKKDLPTMGLLRYQFTGVKYKDRWSKFFGIPYGSKMRRSNIEGERVGSSSKVELDGRALGNLKISRDNFMKVFLKIKDIFIALNNENFRDSTILTEKGEKIYQLIYKYFKDIDNYFCKIVGLNTDNVRRICRKDLGALTSSDNYIRGMDNITKGISQKQQKLDVDADATKTALNETEGLPEESQQKGGKQKGGKQSKANLRKKGIYRQYKLPVFVENRFLQALTTKESAKTSRDDNIKLKSKRFTYKQLGLFKPNLEGKKEALKNINLPYTFFSAAIYEPHIFGNSDILFGTLSFILGRETEIIGAEKQGELKIRHDSLINSIDKLRIELKVKDDPKLTGKPKSKRENRQKMSIVRYYSLFFCSVMEYYTYFLKLQIDKFIILNIFNHCMQIDTIETNNNNKSEENGNNQANANVSLDNILGGGADQPEGEEQVQRTDNLYGLIGEKYKIITI